MKTYKYLITVTIAIISFLNTNAQKNEVENFKIVDIFGIEHNLYPDYLEQGKYVFVDFFSTACGSCISPAKVTDSLYKNLGCNNNDIVFLTIDGGNHTDINVWDFKNTHKIRVPAASGIEGGGNSAHDIYGITATPHFILISPTPDPEIVFSQPAYNFNNVEHLIDSLDNYIELNEYPCTGTEINFFAVTSETDSMRAEIFADEYRIEATYNPDSKTIYQTFFVISGNASLYINDQEQISEESVIDPSAGSITYTVIPESGDAQEWTVNFSEAISINSLEGLNIKFAPNPISEFSKLTINSPNKQNIQISIYDITGKQIISEINTTLESGNNNISIPGLQNLTKAVYVLQINSDKFSQSIRFVK